MTDWSIKLGQYVLREGTKYVCSVPKEAQVKLHNGRVFFFHKDYPVCECTVGELGLHQPNTLEEWLKVVRPIALR